MRIHQYHYVLRAGTAHAEPVSPTATNGERKLTYVTSKDFPCTSPSQLTEGVEDVVRKMKAKVPATTRAHLLVAHCLNTDDVTMDAANWFAVAEAIVRQGKEKILSVDQKNVWENWLKEAWPNIVVPESFKALFDECADGIDALRILEDPVTPMLATICMVACTGSPVTTRGESMNKNPLRISASWSVRSKSMSFRAVYPQKRKSRMNESIEELAFISHTAGVFKLAGRWTERYDDTPVDRQAMQVREFLTLSHLSAPKDENIRAVYDFLKDHCEFTLEEVLSNELPNIEKKNGVMTRRVFEVLLNAEWKNIQSQIELLRATEHPPEAIAAALVEGNTQHVISIDKATGKMDLPELPDFLM